MSKRMEPLIFGVMTGKFAPKSRRLSWLIGLMTVSLLGVSGIQAYWLRQSYLIKENQFDRDVGLVLNGVSQKVQRYEAKQFLSSSVQIQPFFSSIFGAGQSSWFSPDSTQRSGDLMLSISMGGDTVLKVANKARASGARNSSDSLSREMGKSSTIQLSPQRMIQRGLQLDRLLRKMARHELQRRRDFPSLIGPEQLDSLIRYELKQRGISTPFEFAVATGQQVKLQSPGWRKEHSQHAAALFPNDIFSKQVLYLTFPDKENYLLRSLWIMLLASILITTGVGYAFFRTLNFSLRQKRISEIKTDFINNMSHEFKTPIATINLAIDAMSNPQIIAQPEKIKHYSSMIRQENQRMNLQVESVLRMALMEKQELELRRKKVDLEELLESCLQHVKLALENRNGNLKRFFNAGPTTLDVDANHLSNAFINLLDNALKYSPEAPIITVETERIEDYFILRIKDQGMGMTREEQKHIFERFYRVTKGDRHNIKGHGLGLSYAKGIIEAHGGQLSVESEKGRGSTFTVFLPRSSYSHDS